MIGSIARIAFRKFMEADMRRMKEEKEAAALLDTFLEEHDADYRAFKEEARRREAIHLRLGRLCWLCWGTSVFGFVAMLVSIYIGYTFTPTGVDPPSLFLCCWALFGILWILTLIKCAEYIPRSR